jgi:cell wall-associated NlpC family hydrolase
MINIRSSCIKILFLSLIFSLTSACAEGIKIDTAKTSSIAAHELKDYNRYPANVKKLVDKALELTRRHLTYMYGSADPKNGGMDCSGTIYYLLNSIQKSDVPRQSDGIYEWAWRKGKFYAVNGHNPKSFEFADLKPGDLLFWSGTYPVHRDPPISHVMMYLGKNYKNEMLMFGSSNGRVYQRSKMNGVSVFNFELPREHSKSRFLGYSCIPDITC